MTAHTQTIQDLAHNDDVRRLVFDAFRIARKQYFSRAGGDVQLIAKTEPAFVIETFAEHGFTPNWLLSYHYEGEDANLVRFWYDPEQYPEYPFRQDHVRLFVDEVGDGVGIKAHSEASALVHRDAHLANRTLDPDLGAARAHRILQKKGIPTSWTTPDSATQST